MGYIHTHVNFDDIQSDVNIMHEIGVNMMLKMDVSISYIHVDRNIGYETDVKIRNIQVNVKIEQK